jgi:hypothetical protein
MDPEGDPLEEALRLKDRNGGRDYWYWKDKPVEEAGAAEEVLITGGFLVEQLRTRPDDPPDCEAIIDGQLSGIEVTELVHEKSLRRLDQRKRQ